MTKHALGYALFCWLILGWGFLIYMQNIDGVLIRKPLTFSVDTQNLHTDKAVYRRGDPISLEFSLCKNRSYTAQSTWRLINETVVTFPTMGTKIATVGCVKDKWFLIGVIPIYAVSGIHHLEGSSVVTLNPLHQIFYQYRSVDFTVE